MLLLNALETHVSHFIKQIIHVYNSAFTTLHTAIWEPDHPWGTGSDDDSTQTCKEMDGLRETGVVTAAIVVSCCVLLLLLSV